MIYNGEMNTEYEVKFLNIDQDQIRRVLTASGAKLKSPMQLMRRVIIDTPESIKKNAFIRIRDEGDSVTLTYKQFDSESIEGAKEHETTVGDFTKTVDIFSAAGLDYRSYQESKREKWLLDEVEIVIDEWPWLDCYVEIEGQNAASVQRMAEKLGFDWSEGVYGDVMSAYRVQYPHLNEHDTVGSLREVKFDIPLPEMFQHVK